MSVTFYGRTLDGAPIALDIEDPAHLNMNGANCRSFLKFVALEPGADLSGEATLPEVRRGIIRARATFERRVCGYTRETAVTRRPGRCRMIERGIGADYFEMRLDHFERFLNVMAAKGATSICWG